MVDHSEEVDSAWSLNGWQVVVAHCRCLLMVPPRTLSLGSQCFSPAVLVVTAHTTEFLGAGGTETRAEAGDPAAFLRFWGPSSLCKPLGAGGSRTAVCQFSLDG